MLWLATLSYCCFHAGKISVKALQWILALFRGHAVDLEGGAASDGGEEQGQGKTSTLLPPVHRNLEGGELGVGLDKASGRTLTKC